MSGSGISSLAPNIHLPFYLFVEVSFYSPNIMVHSGSPANMLATKYDTINYPFSLIVSYQQQQYIDVIIF